MMRLPLTAMPCCAVRTLHVRDVHLPRSRLRAFAAGRRRNRRTWLELLWAQSALQLPPTLRQQLVHTRLLQHGLVV